MGGWGGSVIACLKGNYSATVGEIHFKCQQFHRTVSSQGVLPPTPTRKHTQELLFKCLAYVHRQYSKDRLIREQSPIKELSQHIPTQAGMLVSSHSNGTV